MKSLAPNTLLQNRYLIVQLIGKGGMGEVYLGVDQRLGSAVAIKRTFFSDDETLMIAFEREAKTLARLRHPVLPKVSDHFNENDIQYLVMEHISGDDLSKRLEITKQPFPLTWVLFWADQLLDALAYLHSHEPPIIHRDIKPQNLKLTSENHIILLDFGLAKNSIGETRLSTSGSVVGYTPHYASMEQIRGTGTTPRSDIYSLCATLYQLLTNTVPPDALTRADSLLNHLPDPIKPLNELNPEVSPSISSVIIKGMSLSAEQRYPSAREMQRALRDAYAQIQTSMTAQTEAFNIADIPQVSSQIKDSSNSPAAIPQAKSEDLSSQIAGQIPQNLSNDYSYSAPQNTEQFSIKQSEENFDATIPYDMPMTGEKTEIIPNGLPSLSQPNPYASPQENFQADNQNQMFTEDFRSAPEKPLTETTGNYPNFNEAQNDPNQATAVNFISLPKNEIRDTPPVPPAPSFAPPVSAAKTSAEPMSAPPKKSNGKLFAIVGGILGLAVLGIAVAGIALYALKTPPTTVTATPSPTATATAEPTVEATPEPTIQADANTDSGNSNAEATLTTETNTEVPSTSDNTVPARVDITPPRSTTVERVAKPTPGRTVGQTATRPTPAQTKPTAAPTVDRRIIVQ